MAIPSTPIADLLAPDHVAFDQNLASKKSVLERAAALLARDEDCADEREIFEALCQRERLGSTGLGHGVAIPHCRVQQSGVSAAFLRLSRPADFDSPDGEGVDMFFALAVPSRCSEAHLKLLSSIAEICGDAKRRAALRQARSHRDLSVILNGGSSSDSDG